MIINRLPMGNISTDDRLFLYKLGDEFNPITGGWVVGYSQGTGSQSKEDDHLYLTTSTGAPRRTYVTNNKIDLSDIKTLFIDWLAETNGNSLLCILNNKTDNYGSAVAQIIKTTAFTRRIDMLDISSLNGEYYVAVFSNAETINTTKAYRIWGE